MSDVSRLSRGNVPTRIGAVRTHQPSDTGARGRFAVSVHFCHLTVLFLESFDEFVAVCTREGGARNQHTHEDQDADVSDTIEILSGGAPSSFASSTSAAEA